LQEMQHSFPIRFEVFAPLAVVALSVCCFKLVLPLEDSRV